MVAREYQRLPTALVVLLVVFLTASSLLGSVSVLPAVHTPAPLFLLTTMNATTSSPHCLLRITSTAGHNRHRVCPHMSAAIEYGQPFVVPHTRCTAVQKNYTAGCETSGPFAVDVEWMQQFTTTTTATTNTKQPQPTDSAALLLVSTTTIPVDIQQHCETTNLRAPPGWWYYQLNDQTQRICGARRPWSCFGANHSAGKPVTRTKCTFAYLHLPPDSLAVAIAHRCRRRQRQEQELRLLPTRNNNNSRVDDDDDDHRRYRKWRTWFASFVSVVRERAAAPANEKPGPRDVVVHLRLGDVIDSSAFSVQELLSSSRSHYPSDNRSVYALAYSYYDFHLTDDLLIQQAHRIVLVGAAHGGYSNKTVLPRTTKSCYYVHLLREYFLQRGAKAVELRLGGLPDDDVLFMAQSRYFVLGGGGFSRTIGWLVEELGGTVFGGGEEKPFFFPKMTRPNQTVGDVSQAAKTWA